MRKFIAIALLVCVFLPDALAQRPSKPAGKPVTRPLIKPAKKVPPKRPARVVSITAMGGAGWPLAKESLTDFWRYGPNGMLSFSTAVNRRLSLGLGVDFTIFPFSNAAFGKKFPALTPPDRSVAWMNVFLLARYEFNPNRRVSPYIQVSFGPSRLTQASFIGVQDSVRQTYYEIHPRSRLALGISAGVEIDMTRWLAWVMEANSVFVYNDPEAGMRVVLRGGFKFTW